MFVNVLLVINDVHGYFGSEVALYFAFMDHFTLWLIPTGALGFMMWLWNYVDVNLDGITLVA